MASAQVCRGPPRARLPRRPRRRRQRPPLPAQWEALITSSDTSTYFSNSFPPPVYWEGKLRQRKGGGRKRGAVRTTDRWESKLAAPTNVLSRILAHKCVTKPLKPKFVEAGGERGGSAGWQALAPKRRRRRRHRSNGRLGLPPPQHVAAAASCRTCPRTHPTWPRPLPRASPPTPSWPST